MKRIIASFFIGSLLFGFFVCRDFFPGKSKEQPFRITTYEASVYPGFIPRTQSIFFEVFSATWCGWCYHAYDIYTRLANEYGLPIHHIRYYNQDTLAMKEALKRAQFYGVTGYPVLVVNGEKKHIGANEQTYPLIAEWVEESLAQEPATSLYTTATRTADEIQVTTILQHFSEQELEVHFISLLMENNVRAGRDKIYHFVARRVFPGYDGLKLKLNSGYIYKIEYSFPLLEKDKENDYKMVSFIQDFSSKKVINSSFYEMNSLGIAIHQPLLFQSDVSRDTLLEIQFEDPLSVRTIREDPFVLMDKEGNKIFLSIDYNPALRTMTIDPRILLKKNTAYVLMVYGGKNSILTSSQKQLRDYFCLPFVTGDDPEIDIYISEQTIEFGEISPIDAPEQSIVINEKNDHPIRISFSTTEKWVEVMLDTVSPSYHILRIKANPLFMKTGNNQAHVSIYTIQGEINVSVEAWLQSAEFPAIRLDPVPCMTIKDKLIIKGQTNGYRFFLNNKELLLDSGGGFYEEVDVQIGINLIRLRSMNMQRKETHKAIVIFRINREN